jgi:hypothetical protein
MLRYYAVTECRPDLIRVDVLLRVGIAIQQRFQSNWIFAGPTSFQLDPARIKHYIDFFKK